MQPARPAWSSCLCIPPSRSPPPAPVGAPVDAGIATAYGPLPSIAPGASSAFAVSNVVTSPGNASLSLSVNDPTAPISLACGSVQVRNAVGAWQPRLCHALDYPVAFLFFKQNAPPGPLPTGIACTCPPDTYCGRALRPACGPSSRACAAVHPRDRSLCRNVANQVANLSVLVNGITRASGHNFGSISAPGGSIALAASLAGAAPSTTYNVTVNWGAGTAAATAMMSSVLAFAPFNQSYAQPGSAITYNVTLLVGGFVGW